MVDTSTKWRGIGTRGSLVHARTQSHAAGLACLEPDENGSPIFQGTVMHLLSRVTVLLAFTVTPLPAMAEPPSITPPGAGVGVAESVHVQPRGTTFAPTSAEVDAVQKRIAIFNTTQAVLDAWFDRKKLTICRGC
jgi:hypothetical protein